MRKDHHRPAATPFAARPGVVHLTTTAGRRAPRPSLSSGRRTLMLRLLAPMIFSGVCAIGLGSAAYAEPQQAPIRVAQATPQAQPKATKAAPGAPAPAADDSVLKQRVEQLEEQLVDMQVVVGTLE